jgi:chromosome segregation ATPase
MMQQIKDVFTKKGELADIERQIKELQKQTLDDKYRDAETDYRKLNNDMNGSNDRLEVRQNDLRELERLRQIAYEGFEITEAKTKKLLELKEKRSEIENDIENALKRKHILMTEKKKDIDAQVADLSRKIKHENYIITRDKQDLLSKLQIFENEIKEIEAELNSIKPNDVTKADIVFRLTETQGKRGVFLSNEYTNTMKCLDENERQAKEWLRQQNVILKGYAAALAAVDADLIQLQGKC